MAIQVTKGQIIDGTVSQKAYLGKYYLCGKFDRFMKKCTINFFDCAAILIGPCAEWAKHYLEDFYL